MRTDPSGARDGCQMKPPGLRPEALTKRAASAAFAQVVTTGAARPPANSPSRERRVIDMPSPRQSQRIAEGFRKLTRGAWRFGGDQQTVIMTLHRKVTCSGAAGRLAAQSKARRTRWRAG